jgi:hypothetical protein
VSADYEQSVEGYDRSTGSTVEVQVGVKQPWLSNAYAAFISDTVYPGPAHGPASIFVRDNTLASDGDRDFARGAISFDLAPKVVHRTENRVFFTRPAAIKVPAGGSRLVRQFYVVGTSQATVNAKAAANEERINPYRPDALIRKGAGGFVGNRVYNDDGAHQTSSLIRSRGSSATFLIKVQNHGTTTDGLTVAGPGAAGGFGVKYLAGATGTRDITTAVVNGTYRLTKLAPGAQRLLRLVVTVQGNAGIAATHSWRVRATSTTDGARRDAVQAKVSVVAR